MREKIINKVDKMSNIIQFRDPLTKGVAYGGRNSKISELAVQEVLDSVTIANEITALEGHLINTVKGDAKKLNDAVTLFRELFSLDRTEYLGGLENSSVKVLFESFICFSEKLIDTAKTNKKLEYLRGISRYLMTILDTFNQLNKKSNISFEFNLTEFKSELVENLKIYQEEYASSFEYISDKNPNKTIENLDNQGNFIIESVEFNLKLGEMYNKTTLVLQSESIFERKIEILKNQIALIDNKKRKTEKDEQQKDFYKTEIQTTFNKFLYLCTIVRDIELAKRVLTRQPEFIDKQIAINYVNFELAEKGFSG